MIQTLLLLITFNLLQLYFQNVLIALLLRLTFLKSLLRNLTNLQISLLYLTNQNLILLQLLGNTLFYTEIVTLLLRILITYLRNVLLVLVLPTRTYLNWTEMRIQFRMNCCCLFWYLLIFWIPFRFLSFYLVHLLDFHFI